MLDMAVVEDNHGIVPLSARIYLHFRLVRKVHCVVHSEFLPFFQFFREIRLVNQLVFRACHVWDIEFRSLHYMIEHAAVAAFGKFPVPGKDEILVLLVCDYIAARVASGTFGLDAAVHDMPRDSKFSPVIITPAVQVLTVKQEFPAFLFFFVRKHVVPACTAVNEHCRCPYHDTCNE